ncbi:TRAP transporter small permease [Aquibium sp. LZ166]|uniref:TRAP transporter small permease protein n=1 Tax=Aquibium pacificus TaxID=3153579 RepID=A0ABV3SM62_9HYPH
MANVLAILAALCLVGMIVMTSLNIVLRRPPFETPVTGAHELTAFMGALVIALALPLNQLRDGNIRVEMLTAWLPSRVTDILHRLVLLVSGALCAVIAVQLVKHAHVLSNRGEVSMTLAIPYYPFILVVGCGFAILSVVLWIQMIAPREKQSEDRSGKETTI